MPYSLYAPFVVVGGLYLTGVAFLVVGGTYLVEMVTLTAKASTDHRRRFSPTSYRRSSRSSR